MIAVDLIDRAHKALQSGQTQNDCGDLKLGLLIGAVEAAIEDADGTLGQAGELITESLYGKRIKF